MSIDGLRNCFMDSKRPQILTKGLEKLENQLKCVIKSYHVVRPMMLCNFLGWHAFKVHKPNRRVKGHQSHPFYKI